MAGFVQGTTATATGSGPTTGSFTNPTASTGSLIVVVTAEDTGSNTTASAITCSDNKGNTYTQITPHWAAGGNASLWYCANATGGSSHQISVGWTATQTNVVTFAAQEFSGVLTASPLDTSVAGATGTSTTATSSSTGTLAQANELVVGVVATDSSSTISLGSGYTNLTSRLVAGASAAMESKIVAATTATTATFSIASSSGWAVRCVTFKLASAVAARNYNLNQAVTRAATW